jgi:hypothetical protein
MKLRSERSDIIKETNFVPSEAISLKKLTSFRAKRDNTKMIVFKITKLKLNQKGIKLRYLAPLVTAFLSETISVLEPVGTYFSPPQSIGK